MKKQRMIILIAVLAAALVWVLWGNLTVGLTKITLTEHNLPTAFQGFTIAQVSDVHNSHLWKQTVKHLEKAKPDIICLTGDLVDSNHTDVDTALAFAAEAVKIAPCYYITGNHELVLQADELEKLIAGLEELGVVVLDNKSVLINREDGQICLVGASWGSSLYQGSLAEYDGYRVLLAHDPKNFESYAGSGYDLVLCGHVHGGQFRIPFLGGLYGPGQGLLPEYDSGVYCSGNTDMVVSRGIGNSILPLRLNNRPEVILITLKA